jgi:hypothetical protein
MHHQLSNTVLSSMPPFQTEKFQQRPFAVESKSVFFAGDKYRISFLDDQDDDQAPFAKFSSRLASNMNPHSTLLV